MDWSALAVSLRLGLWTTLVLLVVGVPLAAWLASARFRLRFLVEAVVALPLVLPPTVLGFYLLVAMGPEGPLGGLYEAIAGRMLPFTFTGLVLASSVHSLPFMVQPVSAAFASVDRRLVEAAMCLGCSRLGAFARVVLPLSLRGLVTGAILTFAHTLGEFGVVLMVGGNIPGVTRTASIAIYDDVQALDYAAAAQTSLVLLLVSFVVLAAVYALQGRHLGIWGARP